MACLSTLMYSSGNNSTKLCSYTKGVPESKPILKQNNFDCTEIFFWKINLSVKSKQNINFVLFGLVFHITGPFQNHWQFKYSFNGSLSNKPA